MNGATCSLFIIDVALIEDIEFDLDGDDKGDNIEEDGDDVCELLLLKSMFFI